MVAVQLGRAPRGRWTVAVSCPFGFPAVVETAPYLADGTPFPTLFYLTCPAAVYAVTREESAGGVEAFRRSVEADPRFGRAFAELDRLQRRRRRELARTRGDDGPFPPADDGGVFERGIGGPEGAARATCLHAYTATLLAAVTGALGGRQDPAMRAEWTALLGDVGRLWCHDARCAGFLPGGWERHAAVDVGTNSVRSLVAVVGESGDVLPLARRALITQLGAELARGDSLEPAARRRTGEAIAALVAEARDLGAATVRLVGTSAARDAADGPAFIAELGRQLGVTARVATGPEEASLSFLGASRDVDGDPVVMDIGGGSTELVRRGEAGADRAEVEAVSLDLGCVRGTAAWFAGDPPSSEERSAARSLCVEAFRPLVGRFGPSGAGRLEATAESAAARATAQARKGSETTRPQRLVGVAGTITTLACLALSLPEYDPDAIHLRTFGRGNLEEVVDRLAGMAPDERAALPCMQQGRAGVIVAGGEILLGAMEALGWVEITVSERDILDGILLAGAGAGTG